MKTIRNRTATIILLAVLAFAFAGCGSSSNEIHAKDGYAEGALNDVMHTCFFAYTVNSASLCDVYEDYIPRDGYDILVANVTIKNTDKDTITMYDTDFQVQWGADEDDMAFDVPITYYIDTTKTLNKLIFPYEYELKSKESRTGHLVFEVPEGTSEFSISYLEYFSDGTTGDVFFVYFPATK